MEVKVLKNILSANDRIAEKNRALLDENGVLALNIMASPGAGKTSIIMSTIKALNGEYGIGVIEGDIASSVDAEKVSREGIPAVQINTGGGCHLDANMISDSLPDLPLDKLDFIFIENVGNLICPASYALGDRRRIIIASIPEGDDKPIKYPIMFHDADLIVLNKVDLAPYVNFDRAAFRQAIKNLNDKTPIIEVSCTTGEGLDEWLTWLKAQKIK